MEFPLSLSATSSTHSSGIFSNLLQFYVTGARSCGASRCSEWPAACVTFHEGKKWLNLTYGCGGSLHFSVGYYLQRYGNYAGGAFRSKGIRRLRFTNRLIFFRRRCDPAEFYSALNVIKLVLSLTWRHFKQSKIKKFYTKEKHILLHRILQIKA